MTQKDIFRIIIKLFGLYTGLNVLFTLPNALVSLYFDFESTYAVVSFLILIFYIATMFVLVFKTDNVIRAFKLDKEENNNQEINSEERTLEKTQFSTNSIIQFGLIAISLYFLIISIPDIVTNIFYAFKKSIQRNSLDVMLDTIDIVTPDYYVLITASIQFVLAFLLLTNKNYVAQRIEKLN